MKNPKVIAIGMVAAAVVLTAGAVGAGIYWTSYEHTTSMASTVAVPSPQSPDEQLAQEEARVVYGESVDQAFDPAKFRSVVIDQAVSTCNVMASEEHLGIISASNPFLPTMSTWIQGMQVSGAKNSAWTAKQTDDNLRIAAKYKCPQYSSMLQAYFAANGN